MSYTGNQLTRVQDAANAGLTTSAPNDFENGATTSYQYDDNGNLYSDPDKGISSIYYNALSLPSYIEFDNGNAIDLLYSSTGEKLRVTSYERVNSAWTIKTVDYVGGFTYSSSAPTYLTTHEGRALLNTPANGSTPARWTQEYHIRDNQGSLRMVLRSTNPVYNRASMELAAATEEESKFDNLAQTRQYDPMHARTGAYSARLNARQANRLHGPATTLSVQAGDTVKMRVFARYDGQVNLELGRASSLAAITIGATQTAGVFTEGKAKPAKRKFPLLALGAAIGLDRLFKQEGKTNNEPPHASLTYQLFNKDSVLVASQTLYVNDAASGEWQLLSDKFAAKEDGYVEIYLTNASSKDVWLDDFVAAIYPPNTTQENHYDPFGQNLVDIETTTSTDDPFQFTGQEKITACNIGLYDYDSRQYNPQLGRFIGVDAEAGSYLSQGPYNYVLNNPTLYTDPDGKNPLLIAAGVGALFGAYSGYQVGQQNGATGWKMAGYIAGGAAIGAISGYAGGAVVQSGIPFANTAALGLTSFTNSFGMYWLSGGETDVYTNFGLGSFNFTTGELGYFGKKGNSSSENFGYALSFLTVASDYTDYKAMQRLENRNSSTEVVDPNRKNMYGNYTGPGPDTDPRKMLKANITPIDALDQGAFNHDVVYYDQGASGVSGAFLSKRVRTADFALARDARAALRSGPGIEASLKTRVVYGVVGNTINVLFSSIGVFKTALQYSYLMPLLPKL